MEKSGKFRDYSHLTVEATPRRAAVGSDAERCDP